MRRNRAARYPVCLLITRPPEETKVAEAARLARQHLGPVLLVAAPPMWWLVAASYPSILLPDEASDFVLRQRLQEALAALPDDVAAVSHTCRHGGAYLARQSRVVIRN